MIQGILKSRALKKGYVIASYKTNRYGWTARLVKMTKGIDHPDYISSLDEFCYMTFGFCELIAVIKAYKGI